MGDNTAYEVIVNSAGQAIGILHFACGKVSWNLDDVAYRYCGKCHKFLDDDHLAHDLPA